MEALEKKKAQQEDHQADEVEYDKKKDTDKAESLKDQSKDCSVQLRRVIVKKDEPNRQKEKAEPTRKKGEMKEQKDNSQKEKEKEQKPQKNHRNESQEQKEKAEQMKKKGEMKEQKDNSQREKDKDTKSTEGEEQKSAQKKHSKEQKERRVSLVKDIISAVTESSKPGLSHDIFTDEQSVERDQPTDATKADASKTRRQSAGGVQNQEQCAKLLVHRFVPREGYILVDREAALPLERVAWAVVVASGDKNFKMSMRVLIPDHGGIRVPLDETTYYLLPAKEVLGYLKV